MSPNDVAPVPADWLKVEAAVVAFEEAYRKHGSAPIAAHAPPPGDPLHLPVVRELVRADLEFAWAAGLPRLVDDYRGQCPALFADPDSLRQVLFEEYRLRLQAGETADPAGYARRYGISVTGWAAGDQPATHPEIVLPATDAGAAADRYPEPGETYLGFRIVRELGRGAFARVFLAEQGDLAGRPVALKVSDQPADEPQTLARLQHTNIVPVYSTHRVGRFQAVCMPYFGGTTLADVLTAFRDRLPASGEGFVSTVLNRRSDPTVTGEDAAGVEAGPGPAANTPLEHLSHLTHVNAALWVAAELADGLAHAHDRGVLHRDVKPANVLLADDGRPMLLDFNLATGAGDDQQVGGTPYYMSPEQLVALAGLPGRVDARSDVYSLGLILYELLAGRMPYPPPTGTAKERFTRLRAERAVAPPSPRLRNPAVSPAAAAVVAKCLAPAAADRYQSAHQLRDDLRRQLSDRPLLHAREPLGAERIAKFVRRNPWVKSSAFLGGLLAVVLAVAVAVALYLITQRDAANRAIAERQFLDEVGDHRLALLAPANDRRKAVTVDRAVATLSRFGLPGGDPAAVAGMKLDPARSPEVRRGLGDLHLLLAAAEAARRTPAARDRADGWLTRAAEADDPAAERARAFRERLRLGQAAPVGPDDILDLLARNEYRRVVEILDKRATTDLRPFEWAAKAQCHTALGQFAEAAACYTTAVALHGRPSYDLLAGRGRAFLELKRYDRAAADLDAALALDPDGVDVLIDRALADLGGGRYREAVAGLDRALDLWPTHTRTLFIRAEAKARGGDKTGAAADRARAMTADPGDDDSWVSRGMAKLAAGDATGAVADFDAALKLNPHSRDARLNTAAALADHQNRTAEAVAVLDGLIADDPDCVPARAGRGVYLARLGKRAAAHADAAEVLKRDPPALFRYQVAGIYALTSKTHPADANEAIRLLASAFQDRTGLEYVGSDPDLAPLGPDAGFRKLVEAARELETRAGRK